MMTVVTAVEESSFNDFWLSTVTAYTDEREATARE